MTGFRKRLESGVVLGAEGYLFELERRGYLKSGPYVPEAVLDFPDAVRELHREFLRAGAEVMVAFTYYGHREKLRMIGREQDLEPLNRDALRLAKVVVCLGDDEVGALLDCPADLLAVHLTNDLSRPGGRLRIVDPRVADVPG